MIKRAVAIAFLLVIFVFGAGTVMKFVPEFQDARGLSFDRKSIAAINAMVDENIKSRNNWININGGFQRGLGMTFVSDAGDTDVYKLKNGQLIYGLDRQDMKWYAGQVKDLNNYVSKTGNGPLLYVQLPFKVKDDGMMPAGSKEYGNDNAAALVKRLKADHVPVLDIRSEMHRNGTDFNKAFISTDQHWTAQTARWAAGRICRCARDEYGLYYDAGLFGEKNWKTRTYKNWFLGSLGKRTGRFFGGVSDFDLVTPKVKTDFEFSAKTSKGRIHREGPFEKSLLDMKNIRKKDYFDLNTYATYIGGDYMINNVTNRLADNDCSVLLVRDSFSCAMQPFLCMNYRSVTAIDLRHFRKQSLYEHLKNHHYDMVVVAYNPSAFTEEQFGFDR